MKCFPERFLHMWRAQSAIFFCILLSQYRTKRSYYFTSICWVKIDQPILFLRCNYNVYKWRHSPGCIWFMITLKLIVLFLKIVVFWYSVNISKYFFSILSSFTMSISRETSESLCFCTIVIKQDILVTIDLNPSLSFTFSSFLIFSNLMAPLPKSEGGVLQKSWCAN